MGREHFLIDEGHENDQFSQLGHLQEGLERLWSRQLEPEHRWVHHFQQCELAQQVQH